MYAAPARRVVHRAVALSIRTPTIMRAPGEAPGMFALESAMDELAVELGLDPVELRRRNEPTGDQERGVPFSSRSLLRCLEHGAERFGWAARDPRPAHAAGRTLAARHRGRGAATYPANRLGARAAAVLRADGRAVIGTGGVDIGTGLYTIVAQVAADALGLPVEAVEVRLADTALPRAPGAGGSWSTASIAPAVEAACLALRRRVAEAAGADPTAAPQGDALLALLRRANLAEASAEAESGPDGEALQRYSMHAFGAIFAEMAVDPDSGEARLRRMLGVYGCGRILNAKTARSQMIGGMVWGIGQALTEEGVLDPRFGHWVNGDLAEYHVPVNADVPALDVVFLDEHDPHVNPLGVKGIGEIGIVGVAPAIANAVFHATGRRVRDLPITPAKLI
jgi:xanthine dehydrogenase YagR molybdenum-binding subunit